MKNTLKQLLKDPQSYELRKAIEICLREVPWTSLSLKSRPYFAPQSHEVHSIQEKDNGYIIESNLLSLTGVYGPLPYVDTERFLGSSYHVEFQAFLDIFHHRLHFAWYRLEAQNALAKITQNLAGFRRKRSLEALRLLIQNAVNLPVSVIPFQGNWIIAPQEEQTRLGLIQGRYNTLGGDALVGRRTWDQTHAIRINIGPMSYQKFQYFLTTEGQNELKNLLLPFGLPAIFYIYVHAKEATCIALNHQFALGKDAWLSSFYTEGSFCAYIGLQ